nr:YetF domain-containing protein [Salinibacillus xinjiangensis]
MLIIADPKINHFLTVLAIILVGILQRLVVHWKIKNRKVGRFITFGPTVVIHNGKIIEDNLRQIRYSVDNVLQMLRQKDVFDLNEVETGIIEANGQLSVYKKPAEHTVTLKDMGLVKTTPSIAFPVVVEGRFYSDELKDFQVNEEWLMKQLNNKGICQLNDVFYVSINRSLELHISLMNEQSKSVPNFYH